MVNNSTNINKTNDQHSHLNSLNTKNTMTYDNGNHLKKILSSNFIAKKTKQIDLKIAK